MAVHDSLRQSELYWQNTLADFSAATFPHLRLPNQNPEANDTASHDIPTQLKKPLSATLPVLIWASWGLVIGCMANSDDVVFGVVASEDSASIDGTNDLVDQGATLAPVRISWSRDTTVADYLNNICNHGREMAPFEHIGLDNIANMSPDSRQACEFQSLLIIQTRETGSSQLPLTGWTGQSLLLHILHDTESISISATFDATVVESWVVEGALKQFMSCFQQLQQSSGTTILADLELVTHDNLKTIWSWNSNTLPSVDLCTHTVIEQHARERPDAVAVQAWDGQLTYSELNTLSSILACRLVELGVRPNKLIPLCFEKSVWIMIALLGVLKAGGGFVLLDPSLPQERLRTIAHQTQSEFILSSLASQSVSMQLLNRVIIINTDFFVNLSSRSLPVPEPDPDSVMYVVFTSGSTGTPKGAMISHRNFSSAMKYQLEHYKVTSRMRMFDFSSYSFVASIANLFISLTAGGCICIPSEHDKRNRLVESIVSLRANVIHLTPSASRLITPDLVPGVELVIFSGEGLHAEDINAWWGKVRVMNVLGLSECAPRSVLNVTAQSPEEATRIGKGIGQVTWVVDPEDHNRLMPIGAVGELLLEGPLVGLGYLNDGARTAQSFIHSPRWLLEGCPSRRPGRQGRLYKTGDLVRYHQDGSLSYVARKDAQVKVRGQRVELGEVEYRIKEALGDVEKVAVDVISPRGEEANHFILTAFTQPNGLFPSTPATRDPFKAIILSITPHIQEHLARNLPSYMIPTLFFTMSKLPTTPTGKIDRRRLRAIGSSFSLQDLADLRTSSVFPKRQPSIKKQQQIQSLWSQVLHLRISSISLDDTFVQLGGDSLGAMKVVSKARKIGLDLSVADILGSLPLEEVANKVQQISFHGPVDIPAFHLLPEESDLPLLSNELQGLYGIQKEAIVDMYPCTPLQEGLFSLSVTQGDYITQRILRLAFDLDLDLFRAAWETVSGALEILRTRIIAPNHGRLLQVVVNQPISFVTATGLKQYLEADKAHHMTLGQPLVRYALVKDEMGLYSHFVLTIHHALYDGWSMRLILDSVEKIYRGQSLGFQPRFNGFIDYVNRQSTELAKSYWLGYLDSYSGTLFPPMAPTIRQPSIDTRFQWDMPMPNSLTLKVTTSSLIRAAWALTVGLWTDANDVVFGVTLSGRNAPILGIEEMAAPTIATVPVRIQWDKHSMIVEYLEAVQRQAIEMIPFEQSGLSMIAKSGDGCRRACEFQTLLLVQPDINPMGKTLGKWESKEYQELNTYALTLEVKLGAGGITVHAGFDSRTLKAQLVQNIVQSFESVLRQLSMASTADKISEIDIMTAQDMERIWNWNNDLPIAMDCCVHTLIGDQTRTGPASPAVHAWNATLSYGELDHLSSKLAWRLQDIGLSPGEIVPLCFEKSAWIIVSLLAVVKAGGAFVLLDNALPEQRLQVIVQQVNARIILSSTDCHSLSLRLAKTVIPVSASLSSNLDNQPERQLSSPTPDSILYIAFTSGSTGTPKGAQVSHRNFASAIYHQTKKFAYKKSWRVFDFASYSFDMSIFAILYTLAAGACLCIPNDEDRKSDLPKAINDMQADSIILTPSVLRTLHPTQVSSLKSIMSIGEPLCRDDVTPWVDAAVQLVNAYGPAECTPVSTINSDVGDGEGNPHVGRGTGHVTWIADAEDHNRLVPIGKVGELLLEGPLVGRGYLGNPEKTQAVFIDDPSWLLKGWTGRPGRRGRLYKTGDLVSYNDDGTLNYINRKDNQVKIRGQRVELGEVEHHIKQYVADASQVVAEIVSNGDSSANSVLVAFVTKTSTNVEADLSMMKTTHGLEPNIEKALTKVLPSYMIPVAVFHLEEIPMTATEKTDRKKLRVIGSELLARQLAEQRTSSPKTKQQPSSPLEVQLQRIWAQVLNVNESDIGVDDSFLQLGGDSITAMRVSSLARALRINISSADVMRFKTISKLAADAAVAYPLTSYSVQSSKVTGKTFPLSPMQNLYMHHQPSPNLPYDQNFLLRLKTKMSHNVIEAAIKVLVERHSILRARFFQDNEGTWQQIISQDISGSVYTCIKRANEDAVADTIAQCRNRLDIVKGPLVTACIVDEDEYQILFLSIHHLVVDLVSWRVLLSDLESILISKDNVASTSLDFLTWASLQEQYAAVNLKTQPLGPTKLEAEHLEYWGVGSLSNKSENILTKSFALNVQATSAILGRCNDAFGTRPVELMIAAVIHSFGSRFTARQSPTVMNEGHGREPWNNTVDVSDTVGWFTTMSPVQVACDVNSSLEDVIRSTKDLMRNQSQNGWANFTSSCKDDSGAKEFAKQFPVEILFNYAGIYQQLERDDAFFERLQLPHSCDPLARLDVQRFALFDIGVRVEKGSLIVSVAYNQYMNHQGEICDWVDMLQDTLTHMSSELPTIIPCWTLTDFPLAFQTYEEMQEFSQYHLSRLGIKHSDVEDIFPCSPLQQGVLAACARDPLNYRAKFAVEVRIGSGVGTLDVSKLEIAWKEVVRKHAVLRSLLINKIGKRRHALYVVLKDPMPSICRIPIQDSTPQWKLQHEISETYGHEELQHHLVIHEIDATTAHLELHISHAIMDGSSLQVLWKDLQEAYNDSQSPTASYRDFVEYLKSQPKDVAADFWSRRLQNAAPCILPASAIGQHSTAFENVQVPIESNELIKEFCSASEITTATLIRLAWAMVLRLYTGSLSPCFGNVNSGRDVPIPRVDKIFGPLISLTPCVISFGDSTSVHEVLKATQQDYLDSLPYQHLPLREIHHMLGLKKKALFNSIVSFQRSWGEEDQTGLSVHHLEAFDPNEYDITVRVSDGFAGTAVKLTFRPTFLGPDEKREVARVFGKAISTIIADPFRKVKEIRL
ncbi:destruxin synthetase, 1 [Trichoderma arundinaceum]|uniref:Destruxin synthetase, 1 n=1 Tax=Trichoderma arundinaceum TaxID=490622 RepID=A0A395NFP5_TRIAR|nr:destruxin synthetase, 1 [Trichoderma arundinaceum]